jgi:hypothetical protein
MLQHRIYGMASQNLRNAVTDIQDKFRDIQRLERVQYRLTSVSCRMSSAVQRASHSGTATGSPHRQHRAQCQSSEGLRREGHKAPG